MLRLAVTNDLLIDSCIEYFLIKSFLKMYCFVPVKCNPNIFGLSFKKMKKASSVVIFGATTEDVARTFSSIFFLKLVIKIVVRTGNG